jgi:hypothetical protein
VISNVVRKFDQKIGGRHARVNGLVTCSLRFRPARLAQAVRTAALGPSWAPRSGR